MAGDITILSDEDKQVFVAELYTQINIPSVDEEDIYNLISNHSFSTRIQIEKGVAAMAYIRLRDMEGYTRVDAFKKVFPDRWTPADSNKTVGARARRLESTDIYKKIILELQMNFYNMFAIERVAVVNESLRRAYSRDIGERYQFEYLKLFLESTKKPEDAKQFEVNVNVNQGGVSISDVEDQLNVIAKALEGKTQGEIVDAVLLESNDTA